ncbi:MAG: alpha/beta hydrolase [Vulcanimicrobiaceae bacterium]
MRWARIAAATLSNSRLLVIPGVGHEVTPSSRCAQRVMRSFLLRPNSPDVSCVAALQPAPFK